MHIQETHVDGLSRTTLQHPIQLKFCSLRAIAPGVKLCGRPENPSISKWGTPCCSPSVICSISNLNRWSSFLGLFCHVPLKRDQRIRTSPNEATWLILWLIGRPNVICSVTYRGPNAVTWLMTWLIGTPENQSISKWGDVTYSYVWCDLFTRWTWLIGTLENPNISKWGNMTWRDSQGHQRIRLSPSEVTWLIHMSNVCHVT